MLALTLPVKLSITYSDNAWPPTAT